MEVAVVVEVAVAMAVTVAVAVTFVGENGAGCGSDSRIILAAILAVDVCACGM